MKDFKIPIDFFETQHKYSSSIQPPCQVKSIFTYLKKIYVKENKNKITKNHETFKQYAKNILGEDAYNHLLYAVPYQHFTNSIENYFSMLKSRLQKLDGLTHAELKDNIINTITNIPKDKYRNIIKGAYERPEKYISNKNKTRKIKKNYL